MDRAWNAIFKKYIFWLPDWSVAKSFAWRVTHTRTHSKRWWSSVFICNLIWPVRDSQSNTNQSYLFHLVDVVSFDSTALHTETVLARSKTQFEQRKRRVTFHFLFSLRLLHTIARGPLGAVFCSFIIYYIIWKWPASQPTWMTWSRGLDAELLNWRSTNLNTDTRTTRIRESNCMRSPSHRMRLCGSWCSVVRAPTTHWLRGMQWLQFGVYVCDRFAIHFFFAPFFSKYQIIFGTVSYMQRNTQQHMMNIEVSLAYMHMCNHCAIGRRKTVNM